MKKRTEWKVKACHPAAVVLLVLSAALATACSRGPKVSDTGYEGTWQRGGGSATSTIAIVKQGDDYLFRWTLDSEDGRWIVRCNWDGVCEEHVDGEKTSDYTFRTWVEPTGFLRIECKGKVTRPKPLDVHYIDQLRVKEGGLRMSSATMEQGETRYYKMKKPKRMYTKVSDAVENPPTDRKPAS